MIKYISTDADDNNNNVNNNSEEDDDDNNDEDNNNNDIHNDTWLWWYLGYVNLFILGNHTARSLKLKTSIRYIDYILMSEEKSLCTSIVKIKRNLFLAH